MPGPKTQWDKLIGIQELYKPSSGESEVDIVAVHGLNGHARRTWTNTPTGRCWLDHPLFLPGFIPNARILSWGYNASFSSLTGELPSEERIHHHAQTLVANLAADRRLSGTSSNPIIFLCHSMGGIVVKRALLYSQSRTGSKVYQESQILDCTHSILFFGTPHHGSSKANWLGYLQKMTSMATSPPFSSKQSPLLKALEKDSETLQNITLEFVPLMRRFHIFFFWEQEKTNLKIKNDYIVSSDSAAPVYDGTERSGIAADHSGMVKFDSPSSQGFRTVVDALLRYCKDAPQVVKSNLTRAAMLRDFEQQSLVQDAMQYVRPGNLVTRPSLPSTSFNAAQSGQEYRGTRTGTFYSI